MSEDIIERLKKWSSIDDKLTTTQLETLLGAISEIEFLRTHAGAVTRGEFHSAAVKQAGGDLE